MLKYHIKNSCRSNFLYLRNTKILLTGIILIITLISSLPFSTLSHAVYAQSKVLSQTYIPPNANNFAIQVANRAQSSAAVIISGTSSAGGTTRTTKPATSNPSPGVDLREALWNKNNLVNDKIPVYLITNPDFPAGQYMDAIQKDIQQITNNLKEKSGNPNGWEFDVKVIPSSKNDPNSYWNGLSDTPPSIRMVLQ
jgi:hypothetical protein